MTLRNYVSICVLLFSIYSCSSGIDKTYSLNAIELNMEGPLFEGPNSASAMHKVDLSSIGVSADKINHAYISKVRVYLPDSSNFNLFGDFKFQFTADEASMVECAQLNPIPSNVSSVDLKTSSEADLKDFFKLSEFVILMDGNLKEDYFENVNFKADLEFTINVTE